MLSRSRIELAARILHHSAWLFHRHLLMRWGGCSQVSINAICNFGVLNIEHFLRRHVGILEIKGSHFQLEPVRLKTVRPFIMDEVVLKDEKTLRPTDHKRVNAFLQDRVRASLRFARNGLRICLTLREGGSTD